MALLHFDHSKVLKADAADGALGLLSFLWNKIVTGLVIYGNF